MTTAAIDSEKPDYKILNYFIIGTLSMVLCSMIYTEHKFTTPALEERRDLLSCIVKHLSINDVTDDEFFNALDESRQPATAKCSKLIAAERQSYWSNFNMTLNSCYKEVDEKKDEDHLTKSLSCQRCMRQKLDETSYELIKLHIAAINQTIVEFKVWQYFTMTPKMQQLLDESRQLEKKSLKDCTKKEKLCDKEIKKCIL